MVEPILRCIYDCVIDISKDNLPKVVKAIDKFLEEEIINVDFNGSKELTIPNVYCLKSVLDMMVGLSKDRDNDWTTSEAIQMYLIFINQTPQGKKFKSLSKLLEIKEADIDYVSKIINMKNNLIDVINGSKMFDVFHIYEDKWFNKEALWIKAEIPYLPEEGVPVIVLTTNGHTAIDWVNEPFGNVPFAHYHVMAWSPIVGNHVKINKK